MAIVKANPRTFNALYQGDPKPNKSTQYATGFKYGRIVKDISYKNFVPLHYTVDFNSAPYMTGLAIQMEYIKDGFWNNYSEYSRNDEYNDCHIYDRHMRNYVPLRVGDE